jgi:dihydroxy-acid dehydratase
LPKGCVAKISGEGKYFEGDAIVYENEHDVIKEFSAGGNKTVMWSSWYCGPKVGQECLKC